MFFNPNLYYVTLALEAVCVYHCIRKGNQNKWIWIIVFVPMIGCLIYFFSEIMTRQNVQSVGLNAGSLFNPGGSIRRLEEQLQFTDTFQNRMALADAYLAQGQIEKAIRLYESCRSGMFEENEHLINQLIIAYAQVGNDEAIIPLAQRIANLPAFRGSAAHMYYAVALGHIGQAEAAEKEFKRMNGRFSVFEPRYYYALFLYEQGRHEEAVTQLRELVNEYKQLTPVERRINNSCYRQAREELKRITTTTSA